MQDLPTAKLSSVRHSCPGDIEPPSSLAFLRAGASHKLSTDSHTATGFSLPMAAFRAGLGREHLFLSLKMNPHFSFLSC